ncbi:DUF3426 domain-containing protein [Salinispirillum sp. LH 10-3-1]|uniref:DUF3426 domain-containing protein n=1 Tax=Salinispirillum sp. LH 10-3-1 TaxID=2952525 RepID=A0AB38YJ53_9GAMM
MTTHITQCPHCSTAFRVSADQLSVAKGAVRCGSCLKVFRADEHLRERMPSGPVRATEPPKKAPAASQTKSAQAAKAEPTPKAPLADASSPFPPDDDEFIFSDMAEEDGLADDEFVFMDGDDELDDDFSDSDDELEFSDSFLSLEDTPDPVRRRLMVEPEEPEFSDAASDDSWALDMLADAERDPPSRPARPSFDTEAQDIPFAAVAKPATKRPVKPTPAAPTYAHHDLDELANRLDAHSGRRGLWTLAAALLMVMLAAQTLWWQRHALHQAGVLQPIYAAVCTQLPCALEPSRPDTSAVRALSSILRPLADQRMRLDAVFVNRSDRPVPFPSVLLELQDLQGQVIADGLFSPSDYVAGDMRPDDLMPPGQPISISINVNRPTADLSNYSLTFHY